MKSFGVEQLKVMPSMVLRRFKQAEAEVVPSSSLVELEVEVRVEVCVGVSVRVGVKV